MKNKIVIACVTAEDLSVISVLSRDGDREVIAVAFDLFDGPSPRELHDQARAAGAARCHVLDVREEFARDCVLPAVDAESVNDAREEIEARGREFIAKKLSSIATLEGATDVVPPRMLPSPPLRSRGLNRVERPAQIEIEYDNGVPRAVNGIAMSIGEVLDSLETIAGAHGIPGPYAALRVLQRAHKALEFALTGGPSRSARLEIFEGRITTAQPQYATT